MIFDLINLTFARSVEQTAKTDSQVEGDANNIIQISNQNGEYNTKRPPTPTNSFEADNFWTLIL